MEKNKFEFQKLELPKEILIESVQTSPIKKPIIKEITQDKASNLGYYAMIAISCFCIGYYLHTFFNPIQKIKATESKSVQEIPETVQIKKESKPTYFNFYDSIIFLNQVKGTKKVISKGFDDYIKKNKLIVKNGDYYYNLFCEDIYNNYSVGDSIP